MHLVEIPPRDEILSYNQPRISLEPHFHFTQTTADKNDLSCQEFMNCLVITNSINLFIFLYNIKLISNNIFLVYI